MGRIVLAGGSGYLGRHLSGPLLARGDEVVVLTRGASRTTADGARWVTWDGETAGAWAAELDGATAVVNLAGQRVDTRPTRRNIDELITSRVQPVRAIGEAMAGCRRPPVWVQLSTMAVYGEGGDTIVDETVPPSGLGPPQMVQVALAWEAAYRHLEDLAPRGVLVRAGIAIGGDDDPATARLRLLARAGLGGPIAGGDQWVSWIALDDLLAVLLRAVDHPAMAGTYHATAPTPVTNREMMATYRRLVGRRVGLPAPAIATRVGAWLLGSDPALALTGRRGVPGRLLAEGFRFGTPSFEDAVGRALTAA